jgi:hypothetical protein
VVWDAGEPGKTVGMAVAEAGEPLVVDAKHLAGGIVVIDPAGGAENAVQHLGLDAVADSMGLPAAADGFLAGYVQQLQPDRIAQAGDTAPPMPIRAAAIRWQREVPITRFVKPVEGAQLRRKT